MDMYYNKHYITVDAQSRITNGWSDGPCAERDTTDAICINEQGGYQFRLAPDGEENPSLYTMDGIPLYRWDGQAIQPRTGEEIAADRAALPAPPPSEMERLRADVESNSDQITDLQMAVCDMYEANMALKEQLGGE